MDAFSYADHWVEPVSETPGRLFRRGFVWMAVIIGLTFLLPVLYGAAIGIHNSGGGPPWTLDRPLTVFLSGLGLDAGLIVASLYRGRAVGDGRLRDGLGLDPIERPGLLIFLILACMAVPAFYTLIFQALLHEPLGWLLQDRLHQAWGDGPPTSVRVLIMTVIMAPIAEELFFRGWLWTGLSRHMGPLAVCLLTGIPFLLAHLPGGSYKPIILIPATIFISVARHCCGGIRASMLVHGFNNLAAMASLLVMHTMVR